MNHLNNTRSEDSRSLPGPHPRFMSVANQKGGQAKTTTSINLAANFGDANLFNKRVLLIDTDPQNNVFDFFDNKGSGIEVREAFNHLFPYARKDFTSGHLSVEEMNALAQEMPGVPNVKILTNQEDDLLEIYGDLESLARKNRENIYSLLRGLVLRQKDFFNQFDIVIFDTPPSRNVLSANIFGISDFVLVTVAADKGAIRGVDKLISDISKHTQLPRSKVVGFVHTRKTPESAVARKADRVGETFLQAKSREFQIPVIGEIFEDTKVRESDWVNPIMSQYSASSRAAFNYLQLTHTLAEKFGWEPVASFKELING